jgi:hypothetical protein
VFSGDDRGTNSVRCQFLLGSYDHKYVDTMAKVKATLAEVKQSSNAANQGSGDDEEEVYDSDEDAEASTWEGTFSDTNHPGCPRTITFTTDAKDTFTISGHDGDKSQPWEGSGVVLESGNIVIDLSSKGGPASLEGKWTGTGICWVKEGDDAIDTDGSDNWPKEPKNKPSGAQNYLGQVGVPTEVSKLEAVVEEVEEAGRKYRSELESRQGELGGLVGKIKQYNQVSAGSACIDCSKLKVEPHLPTVTNYQ